jgi:transmembrane sensor
MSERFAFARDALDRAEDTFDDARVERLLARTQDAVVRRRRQRIGSFAVAAALVLAAGFAAWSSVRELGRAAGDAGGAQALDQGAGPSAAGWTMDVGQSRVVVVRGGTDLRALADVDGRAGFELLAGEVRVDAVMLRVIVAEQQLVADAATFELATAARGFELRVLTGEVMHGERRLVAGDRLVFDPGALAQAAPAPLPAVDAAEVEATPDGASTRPRAKATSKPKWRALVQSRDWADAYKEMKRADPKTVRASVDALMAAADAARFGGHPDEAPSYLKEVLEDHSRHAMAPLAAFTLGRVYLEQLGAAEKAAAAFARARALAPAGALADDALAREVEAWAKAGDRDKARARAREYLERHPSDRRAAAVRRHADLPAP